MHVPHRPASDAHPTSPADQPGRASSPAVRLLLGLLALYGLACVVGWPQGGRDRIVAAQRAEAFKTKYTFKTEMDADAKKFMIPQNERLNKA